VEYCESRNVRRAIRRSSLPGGPEVHVRRQMLPPVGRIPKISAFRADRVALRLSRVAGESAKVNYRAEHSCNCFSRLKVHINLSRCYAPHSSPAHPPLLRQHARGGYAARTSANLGYAASPLLDRRLLSYATEIPSCSSIARHRR